MRTFPAPLFIDGKNCVENRFKCISHLLWHKIEKCQEFMQRMRFNHWDWHSGAFVVPYHRNIFSCYILPYGQQMEFKTSLHIPYILCGIVALGIWVTCASNIFSIHHQSFGIRFLQPKLNSQCTDCFFCSPPQKSVQCLWMASLTLEFSAFLLLYHC